MRYQIGQSLFVVNFVSQYDIDNKRIKMFSMPLRHNTAMPALINFQELKVVSHHRVPGEHDDEIKHDGFLLQNNKNQVFENQYPRAAYGWSSDGDRKFSLHMADSDRDTDLYKSILSGDTPYEFQLLTDVLERFERGIIELKSEPCSAEDKERAALLLELCNNTIKQFHQEFPGYELKYSLQPLWKGGDKQYPHYEIIEKE